MALNTFKYINVYYNKGDKKPYDVNGKPIAYLGQDFVGANEATIIRFYIGSDTGVINAVADVKRPDGEKAFALLDKVNTAEGVAWEFALTDWFCAKAGKLTIAFKAFNGVVTVVNNTIQSNNLRVIVSDIFNIDIGYAPNSVEDAPPFNPNDVATFVNALSGKLDKVGGINVVEALPTPTDGSLNGRWYLLKSGGGTVFPYIESSEPITFSATAPIVATVGDYWYNTTTNVLSFAIGSVSWAPVTSTNGTITPAFGNSADLYFVNTTSSKLFVTQSLTYKDIGRLYVFNVNTPVEVELGVETLKLKSTGNGDVTADTAKLSWNQPNGTINLGLYNDVNIGVGEDVIYYVKATGAITKGDVIQYAGYQGDHALAKRAVQSEVNANPKLIMGIAKQNIANGDFGYVAHFGKLEGVDTKSQAVNSFVWFDSAGSTAGNWTTTEPTYPRAKILLAVIIKAESSAEANNGVLLVRPTIESKLSDLQGMNISSVGNRQILRYNSTFQSWENSSALTTAENNIDDLIGRIDTEETNVDNLQGRMTSAEGKIEDIETGITSIPRANGDENGELFTTTYLKKTTASSTYVSLSSKGQPNGVASLGGDGRVPPSQLPASIGEILEFETFEEFPFEGTAERIYIAKDTNITYRWSGTQYVEISQSLALGETSESAYRGDRGKIAYDHSQIVTGNPHGTTIGDIGAEPANANIQAHISSTTNPHSVTATQVNLGNVTNESKATMFANPTFTGTVGGVTKSMVGLGNVDDTSDANKPVSTAQQTALDLKLNTSTVGAVNGVASLDSQSKIPLSQVPSSIIGGMKFDGAIDITDNVTNTLSKIAEEVSYNSVADIGNYQIVSYGGTIEEGAEVNNYIGKWEFGVLEEDIDPTTTLTLEAGDWLVVTNVQPNTPTSGKFTVTFAVINNTYQDATTSLKGVTRLSDATTYSSLTGNDVVTEGVLKTTVDNAGFSSGTHIHGNITNTGAIGTTANLPIITSTSGVLIASSFGTTSNTFTEGNDSRLSDSRTPVSHTHGEITNAGAITSAVITPATGDTIILSDTSASDVLKRGISIGTATTTFLRNDGTWATPAGGGGGGTPTYTEIALISLNTSTFETLTDPLDDYSRFGILIRDTGNVFVNNIYTYDFEILSIFESENNSADGNAHFYFPYTNQYGDTGTFTVIFENTSGVGWNKVKSTTSGDVGLPDDVSLFIYGIN
jgi:hypothetical protein